MKNYLYYIVYIVAFFVVFDINTYSQTYFYGDSIEITVHNLKNRQIQWQISNDSLSWVDLSNKNDSILKYFINEDSYFHAKIISDSCSWTSNDVKAILDEKRKVFGVKIDRSNVTENRLERIYNAKEKNAYWEIEGKTYDYKNDDMANVYPFNQIKICNIVKDTNKQWKVVYSSDLHFNRNEDTFVEIPLFYMSRYIDGNYEYRLISQTDYPDFYPAPMFVENGKIINKIYIGVYETSVDGSTGIAKSVTGKIPATSKTISDFRNLYKSKGNGFSSIDLRTLMSLQHLYLIYFANKNSQQTIGCGITELSQPINKILNLNDSISDKIVISTSSSSADYYWYIGEIVCLVNGSKIVNYAKLIDIKKDVPIKGQSTFILDKNVSINSNLTFGASAQITGLTDVLENMSGVTKEKSINNKGTSAVKLFNIENLWGNVWEFVDGLIFKGLTPLVGFDMNAYNDEGNSYMPMSFLCLEQPVNGSKNDTYGFIDNLGIDFNYTWLCFPETIGLNGVSDKLGYGDFFYQINNLNNKVYSVFGGGFDHYWRTGLFTFRNWNELSVNWYLYGSRMQFKFLN